MIMIKKSMCCWCIHRELASSLSLLTMVLCSSPSGSTHVSTVNDAAGTPPLLLTSLSTPASPLFCLSRTSTTFCKCKGATKSLVTTSTCYRCCCCQPVIFIEDDHRQRTDPLTPPLVSAPPPLSPQKMCRPTLFPLRCFRNVCEANSLENMSRPM